MSNNNIVGCDRITARRHLRIKHPATYSLDVTLHQTAALIV